MCTARQRRDAAVAASKTRTVARARAATLGDGGNAVVGGRREDRDGPGAALDGALRMRSLSC